MNIENGISKAKVSRDRWEQAQAWERQHWITTQKARGKYGKNIIWKILTLLNVKEKYHGTDWNGWWKERFNHYDFLPGSMSNMVELGCGPYTNARLIIPKSTPEHLFLCDPLIRTYVNFKQTFIADMYKSGFCIIDDHPIEECPFAEDYFDLTVMINVLDHVKDAELCLGNAIKITKPGGIFIFGQDLTNEEDLLNKKGREDVGHPIHLDQGWCDQFIQNTFEPIIYKILSRENGRGPHAHYGTMIFAGRKIT